MKLIQNQFRHIAPHFKNYKAIGDSNTKNLKFGNGVGTFVMFMPGNNIKASKIENVPEPEETVPARNIFIHTVINDINCDNRKPRRVVIKSLNKNA